MRKLAIILSFAVLLSIAPGCDFLRRLSGRPTSDEIEMKRALIQADREIAAARAAVQDSLQAAIGDSLPPAARKMLPATAPKTDYSAAPGVVFGTVSDPSGNWRYAVVIGSFANDRNAGKLLATAQAKKYNGMLIRLDKGLLAVCLCPTGDLNEVLASLQKVRKEAFCPAGAWILENI